MVGVGGIGDIQMRSLEAVLKDLGADKRRLEEALEEFRKLQSDIGTLKDRLSAIAKHVRAGKEAVRAHEWKEVSVREKD